MPKPEILRPQIGNEIKTDQTKLVYSSPLGLVHWRQSRGNTIITINNSIECMVPFKLFTDITLAKANPEGQSWIRYNNCQPRRRETISVQSAKSATRRRRKKKKTKPMPSARVKIVVKKMRASSVNSPHAAQSLLVLVS